MAVPRNRLSNARKNKRRAHDAKKPANWVLCSNCSQSHLPHTLCQSCGHYNGRRVMTTEEEE